MATYTKHTTGYPLSLFPNEMWAELMKLMAGIVPCILWG